MKTLDKGLLWSSYFLNFLKVIIRSTPGICSLMFTRKKLESGLLCLRRINRFRLVAMFYLPRDIEIKYSILVIN